jgi:hypothetical protein
MEARVLNQAEAEQWRDDIRAAFPDLIVSVKAFVGGDHLLVVEQGQSHQKVVLASRDDGWYAKVAALRGDEAE